MVIVLFPYFQYEHCLLRGSHRFETYPFESMAAFGNSRREVFDPALTLAPLELGCQNELRVVLQYVPVTLKLMEET